MELGPLEPVVEPLTRDFSVLMVCTANICRSPAAEALLRMKLANRKLPPGMQVTVSSAGIRGWDQHPMDSDAAAALANRGISADGFFSRRLTEQMVADADLVLTATKEHRSDLLERFPRGLRKTFTMREFASLLELTTAAGKHPIELVHESFANRGAAGLTEYDVDDPYGGTRDDHERAMATIDAAITAIAAGLAHD